MVFLEGEMVILNDRARNGLPCRIGEIAVITDVYYSSPNYDYIVQFDDGDTNPVKSSELNKLTEEQKKLITYIFTGNKVLYENSNEIVTILKVDYLNGQVEIQFDDGSSMVADINNLEEIDDFTEEDDYDSLCKFTDIALKIGEFTDMKNKQYGSSVDATYKMIQVLMERYTYDDENYLMPKSLLQHILLQVRMMDKQNRIFNNPSGEGDSESPYNDLAGYSLIGIDMVSK